MEEAKIILINLVLLNDIQREVMRNFLINNEHLFKGFIQLEVWGK